jgi:CysZ protein
MDFLGGLTLPFAAMSLIARTASLRKQSWMAAGVIVVSLIALVIGAVRYTPELLALVLARPEAGWALAGWYLLVAIAFLLIVVIGANVIPLLLLAPLQDALSESAEEAMELASARPFSVSGMLRDAARALAHTLARIVFLLLGHAALLLLHLLPVIGSAAWAVLAHLWTMWWLAGEYLDAPMSRHGHSFSELRRAMAARPGLCLGLGAGTYVLLWIPVVNFFLLPVAVVAGTLLYHRLLASGVLQKQPPSAA